MIVLAMWEDTQFTVNATLSGFRNSHQVVPNMKYITNIKNFCLK